MDLSRYDIGPFFDETFAAPGAARDGRALLARWLEEARPEDLAAQQRSAEQMLLDLGITFNVYGHEAGAEKIFPFDVVPRILPASDWSHIERGLVQRITALNLFLGDVYGAQRILKDNVVPRSLVESADGYLPACKGVRPPKDVFCHVVGTDLVRDKDGQFYVLEDNLRCPSGVSYVLENRSIMKRLLPHLVEASRVMPVDGYPSKLLETLQHVSPGTVSEPVSVLLTPGIYNSAYFEHSFLAQQMGIELVEGRDLVVRGGYLMMRTTQGYRRVDVVYRRVDDTFLDPRVFRSDSLLGVPGLFEVYKSGRVALANAPGTGVADDKVIYAYVPRIIEYYLGEKPLLPNVPTYACCDDKDREHVLANLDSLVVKAANESGGYGMLMGPQATPEERDVFRKRITDNPRNYIAQPLVSLSRVPTLVDGELSGRHVDLRPYVLFGESPYVLPGGLTRVALRAGSYVVNSSQGGGSKDTWVLQSGAPQNGTQHAGASRTGTTPIPGATKPIGGR